MHRKVRGKTHIRDPAVHGVCEETRRPEEGFLLLDLQDRLDAMPSRGGRKRKSTDRRRKKCSLSLSGDQGHVPPAATQRALRRRDGYADTVLWT